MKMFGTGFGIGRFGFARCIAVLAALLMLGTASYAQQKPSAAAMALANQIITLKGAGKLFEPLIPGVIEQGKNMLLQQNPALQKDLNEVTAKLRSELAPRQVEVMAEVSRAYASHFTEAELKDILAFYKSPVGNKMIEEEPKALDQSMQYAQDWAIKFSDEALNKIRAEMKKKGHNL